MRELFKDECLKPAAGFSDVATVCIEGTGIGALVGGALGGLITSPVYYALLSRDGISSSHQLASFVIMGLGVLTGASMGSMIGGSSSYLAACQLENGEH